VNRDNQLENAQIDWSDAQPRSSQFGDIYFSLEDGIAETEHVFIQPNDLTSRFTALEAGSPFVIAETGFGTGLNFLCARRAFLKAAPSSTQLHFISCEKYPLKLEDLRQAHQLFATDADLSSGCMQLQSLWPTNISGFHRLSLDDGRVQLTLLYGDAAVMLAQLNAKVDCWFLDGFAPSMNPDMWCDELFAELARLSHSGTSLSTFTCAGVVKRGLKQQGFCINKIPGFGRKREMLQAHYQGDVPERPTQPWLKRPTVTLKRTNATRIAVIGGGLSGTTTAHALAIRGYKVDLFEQHTELASEGSGNPQGALYAKLPAKPTLQSRLHLAGLQYTVQMLKGKALVDGVTADLCGLLQLALDPKEVERFNEFEAQGAYPEELVRLVSAAEATELAGTECAATALYFPTAGWVSPRELSKKLAQHPNIRLISSLKVEQLERQRGSWRLNGAGELYSSVVLCTAWRSDLVSHWASLGLKPIRGQTSWAKQGRTELRKVVCGKGYISPPTGGQYCFGSSFIIGDQATDVRQDEHEHNLAILAHSLPQLASELQSHALQGKAAQRAGSRDYMPLIGPLCNQPQMQQQFKSLSKDARRHFSGEAPWLDGIYVNLGHGSKGLITCPLSAEILAAQINNEPYPVEQALVDLISPQRFTIRELIRSGG